MKLGCYFFFIILISACQGETKTKIESTPSKSVLDSIADAYGYQEWKNVDQISFTFNVERPTRKMARSWHWDVKNNLVSSTIDTVTVSYSRLQIDSTNMDTDAQFINDKYWLLFPFNLVWDRDNFTYEVERIQDTASGLSADRKVTIVYGDSGGYTPGDAYDFHIDASYRIKDWAWRKGNDSVARIRTILQSPHDYKGVKITTRHEGMADDFVLHFTSVKIEKVSLK